jgi:hypothetical protein
MYLHCGYEATMEELRFEWDAAKDAANRRKHGVAFEEAASVFYDENGALMDDPEHSTDEDRLVLLGTSHRIRLWWCVTATEKRRR